MTYLVHSKDMISIDDIKLDEHILMEIDKMAEIYIEKDPEGDYGTLINIEEVVLTALRLYVRSDKNDNNQ